MHGQGRLTRKNIIIIVSLVTLLFIAAIVVNVLINNNKKTFGDTVNIAGLKENTQGKPDKKVLQEFIQYEALRVVNLNSKEPKAGKDIEDAVIREGSFNQSNDSDNGLHRVTFILDIKSLRQSYNVSYGWTDVLDAEHNSLTENISYVKCLPADKLIYGEFDCVDFDSVIDAPSDPILRHLPHSTLNYRVVLDPVQPYTLNVDISTTAADERGDAKAAINRYKKQVLDWISSIGFDPQDYSIKYTYNRASIY